MIIDNKLSTKKSDTFPGSISVDNTVVGHSNNNKVVSNPDRPSPVSGTWTARHIAAKKALTAAQRDRERLANLASKRLLEEQERQQTEITLEHQRLKFQTEEEARAKAKAKQDRILALHQASKTTDADKQRLKLLRDREEKRLEEESQRLEEETRSKNKLPQSPESEKSRLIHGQFALSAKREAEMKGIPFDEKAFTNKLEIGQVAADIARMREKLIHPERVPEPETSELDSEFETTHDSDMERAVPAATEEQPTSRPKNERTKAWSSAEESAADSRRPGSVDKSREGLRKIPNMKLSDFPAAVQDQIRMVVRGAKKRAAEDGMPFDEEEFLQQTMYSRSKERKKSQVAEKLRHQGRTKAADTNFHSSLNAFLSSNAQAHTKPGPARSASVLTGRPNPAGSGGEISTVSAAKDFWSRATSEAASAPGRSSRVSSARPNTASAAEDEKATAASSAKEFWARGRGDETKAAAPKTDSTDRPKPSHRDAWNVALSLVPKSEVSPPEEESQQTDRSSVASIRSRINNLSAKDSKAPVPTAGIMYTRPRAPTPTTTASLMYTRPRAQSTDTNAEPSARPVKKAPGWPTPGNAISASQSAGGPSSLKAPAPAPSTTQSETSAATGSSEGHSLSRPSVPAPTITPPATPPRSTSSAGSTCSATRDPVQYLSPKTGATVGPFPMKGPTMAEARLAKDPAVQDQMRLAVIGGRRRASDSGESFDEEAFSAAWLKTKARESKGGKSIVTARDKLDAAQRGKANDQLRLASVAAKRAAEEQGLVWDEDEFRATFVKANKSSAQKCTARSFSSGALLSAGHE